MVPNRGRSVLAPLARAAAAGLCLVWPAVGQETAASAPGSVNFSFDQVDVRAFVKLVGGITARRFVVADGVDGKITVVAPPIRMDEVYPLFVTILQSVGCSVIEEEGIHRVVPLGAPQVPGGRVLGPSEAVPVHGVVTKIIRLQHVSAGEMRKAVEPHVRGGKGGAIGAVEETNHLVVTDAADVVRRIERIVAEIDQPGLARVTEVVRLKSASADDMADQLGAALAEEETRADRLRRRLPAVSGAREGGRPGPAIVPVPHANSLLLVGTASQIAAIKDIVAQMDVEAASGRGRLNAVFLRYVSADEAAESINTLLGKTEKMEPGQQRRISIAASKANNALLVDASPADLEVVRQLVDQMDRLPEQVHIEVLIVEHSVGDGLDLGVEMAALEMPSGQNGTTVQGSSLLGDANSLLDTIQKGVFPRGLTVGVAHGRRVDASGREIPNYPAVLNVDALRKSNRFKLLSQTSLEAQNNREATVRVVNEIPILKSTVQGGAGASRDVIQNIERMDVGIKLKLKPHIIPGGEVQMVLNPSIEAVVDPGPPGTTFAPTIARREVSTTVSVRDGQTIVIAGLTREDEKSVERRVPVLGSVPLLGLLFRRTMEAREKTNVLILVTPHLVTEEASARSVLDAWKKRTGVQGHEEK